MTGSTAAVSARPSDAATIPEVPEPGGCVQATLHSELSPTVAAGKYCCL